MQEISWGMHTITSVLLGSQMVKIKMINSSQVEWILLGWKMLLRPLMQTKSYLQGSTLAMPRQCSQIKLKMKVVRHVQYSQWIRHRLLSLSPNQQNRSSMLLNLVLWQLHQKRLKQLLTICPSLIPLQAQQLLRPWLLLKLIMCGVWMRHRQAFRLIQVMVK